MRDRVLVVGSYLSPYVRKVLVFLDLKKVAYEIDPIIPFMGDDRFSKLSPVRRVPVLLDDRVALADSSVICQYIEERYPQPALYPTGIVERARARWLEEYADSRMGEVFIWRLFNQVAINPFVWGVPTDHELLEKTLCEEIPNVLAYLEAEVPHEGFFFGAVSIADIAIASFFRNATFARFRVDAARWPLTASFIERVLALASFEKLKRFEERLIRTPIPQHRAVLAEMDAPLSSESYGTTRPRRGVLRI
jgi:glutathione S-transferase